jgi:site-specific DNA-methyltransferase (adenine-specific)
MIKLYKGDCLEVMKDIPDKSINLVLIDPPYNIKKAKWDKWKTVNEYVEFMGKVFLEIQRVLKDNGSFYFFHNDFLQIVELQNWINKNTNFIFKSFLVWNKRFNEAKNKGFLDGFCEVENLRNYQQMAEYCLYYTFQDETGLKMVQDNRNLFKPLREYFWCERQKIKHLSYKEINEIIGFASNGGGVASGVLNSKKLGWRFPKEETYNKFNVLGICQKPYEELRQEYEELRQEYEEERYTFNNLKHHHSVMNYEIAPKQGHITPKPVDLLEYIIKTSSNENDTILDCFMGSGSTGVACKHTNRRFIGIELDDNYFEIAKKRIEEE